MKTNNRILLLLLPAASLLPVGGLGAQQPDRRPGPPSPAQMLERFDANGNGSLEEEELESAFRLRREWIEERRGNRFGPSETRRQDRPNQRFDQDGRPGKYQCPCGGPSVRGRGTGSWDRAAWGRSDPADEFPLRGRAGDAWERPVRGSDEVTGDRPLRSGRDERRSPQARRSVILVERFDADGDGLLSPREVEDLLTMLRRIAAARNGQGPRN